MFEYGTVFREMQHLCLKREIVTGLDKWAINYRRLRLGPSGCLKQHQVLAEANFLCCNIGAAGKQQPSRVNLSHKRDRFSFPSLVLSCGKKITPRAWHTCVSCSVPPRAALSQGWGPLLGGGQSRTGTFTAGFQSQLQPDPCWWTWPPESWLLSQDPWSPGGPPCCQAHSTRYLHPPASLPQCPSPPWTVHQPRERSQGWADCWWTAKRCKEMTVTHNLLSRRAISSHSGLLGCSFK